MVLFFAIPAVFLALAMIAGGLYELTPLGAQVDRVLAGESLSDPARELGETAEIVDWPFPKRDAA